MYPAVGKLILVIVLCCYGTQVSGEKVCRSTGIITSTNINQCKQVCDSSYTCDDTQCSNYENCVFVCSARCGSAICFNSSNCKQVCSQHCSQLTCNSTQCNQVCSGQCSNLMCNSMGKCNQVCSGKCGMFCTSSTSCNQTGVGEMVCESESCKQNCTKSNCSMTCNARKCYQICHNDGCHMTCSSRVEECIQSYNASTTKIRNSSNTACIRPSVVMNIACFLLVIGNLQTIFKLF